MTEKKRFMVDDAGELIDKETAQFIEYGEKVCDLLNEQNETITRLKKENEQLKQSVNNLKNTIIKITIAYQRKYDRTIVDLVDEIYEEDITDLIKELRIND